MSKGDLQAVAQRAIEGREAAGAPRTQGKAESAGAEHRAAEGEHGAKMPDDYCELWAQGRAASALCAHRRPEGLEWRAHGAKRSAQPRNTGPLKAARCEDAGRPLRIVDSLLPRPPACQKDFFDKLFSIRIIPQAAN